MERVKSPLDPKRKSRQSFLHVQQAIQLSHLTHSHDESSPSAPTTPRNLLAWAASMGRSRTTLRRRPRQEGPGRPTYKLEATLARSQSNVCGGSGSGSVVEVDAALKDSPRAAVTFSCARAAASAAEVDPDDAPPYPTPRGASREGPMQRESF